MLDIADYNAGVREVTREEAESMTRRIRVAIQGTWELIRDAYLSRVWLPLGYESWDEYTDAEFGASRLRLPREERREAVASLRDAGLSLRAISSGLGVSKPTVIKDLRESEEVVKSLPPAPPTETVEAAPPVESPAPREVTGTDGKTYTKKPRPVETTVVDMQTGEVSSEEEYWDQKNAEQGAQSLGRALITLRALKHEMKRNIYLDKWLPRGLDAVPPGEKELITPANMRLIAGYLNQFATDMEKSK